MKEVSAVDDPCVFPIATKKPSGSTRARSCWCADVLLGDLTYDADAVYVDILDSAVRQRPPAARSWTPSGSRASRRACLLAARSTPRCRRPCTFFGGTSSSRRGASCSPHIMQSRDPRARRRLVDAMRPEIDSLRAEFPKLAVIRACELGARARAPTAARSLRSRRRLSGLRTRASSSSRPEQPASPKACGYPTPRTTQTARPSKIFCACLRDANSCRSCATRWRV